MSGREVIIVLVVVVDAIIDDDWSSCRRGGRRGSMPGGTGTLDSCCGHSGCEIAIASAGALGLVEGAGSGTVAVLGVDGWVSWRRYTTAAESDVDLVFVGVIGTHFDGVVEVRRNLDRRGCRVTRASW